MNASTSKRKSKIKIRNLSCFGLILLTALAAAGGAKKQVPTTIVHPGLVAEVEGLKVTAAEQNCANYAWAAALDTVLRAQQIDLGQDYWADRVTGARCEDNAPALEDTARLVEGEYGTMGAQVRVTTTLIAGPPRLLDGILMSLKQGRPAILYWRSHPYVLEGVLYDEAVYPTGNKLFEARELRLRDPLAPGAEVKFVRNKDDADEIDGVLLLSVAAVN